MKFSTILNITALKFKSISTTPLLDAELLLAHVLRVKREFFYIHGENKFIPNADFEGLVARRMQGEPIAYILGKKEFWSLELMVTPDVLLPRPETELLVELALQKLASQKALEILDLGTGSGAIALALKHERPDWEIYAIDSSAAALKIAQQNAAHLGLKINFIHSDWFASIKEREFDAIIANPPYVAENDVHLARLKYEPQVALVAGKDGLNALRFIIKDAAKHLVNDGWLMLEHGFAQGDAVLQLMKTQGFKDLATDRDLAGQPRVTAGIKKQ